MSNASTINNEDYFQINSEILASFSKHRPPLDLYVFREDICVLEPIFRKGGRLTDQQAEKIAELCAAGNLFVAHSDQNVYKRHMVRQLDLVLLDPNLKEGEVAELCILGVTQCYNNYYEQPVPDMMELLYRDVMVITEYIWNDKHRINSFMRRLYRKWSPAKHAVNTMIVGTWLWMQKEKEYARKEFDRLMLAMTVHDVGMCKVPQFLLTKASNLKPDERDKMAQHTISSVKLMQKSDLKFEELIRACFEHHERMDGSGYPQHLKGNQISSVGKITAVADSFAAMITERPYAKAKDFAVAAKELYENAKYDTVYSGLLSTAFVAGGPLSEHVDMDAKFDDFVSTSS
ncbi:MAG: HD domain-containing protein [Desulfovibrio sp.]|nr:HD domain-containing protein [Desulfovibrio sp.]